MDLERLQRLWREGAADVELLKGLLRALLHEERWVEAREVAYEAVARREVDVRVVAGEGGMLARWIDQWFGWAGQSWGWVGPPPVAPRQQWYLPINKLQLPSSLSLKQSSFEGCSIEHPIASGFGCLAMVVSKRFLHAGVATLVVLDAADGKLMAVGEHHDTIASAAPAWLLSSPPSLVWASLVRPNGKGERVFLVVERICMAECASVMFEQVELPTALAKLLLSKRSAQRECNRPGIPSAFGLSEPKLQRASTASLLGWGADTLAWLLPIQANQSCVALIDRRTGKFQDYEGFNFRTPERLIASRGRIYAHTDARKLALLSSVGEFELAPNHPKGINIGSSTLIRGLATSVEELTLSPNIDSRHPALFATPYALYSSDANTHCLCWRHGTLTPVDLYGDLKRGYLVVLGATPSGDVLLSSLSVGKYHSHESLFSLSEEHQLREVRVQHGSDEGMIDGAVWMGGAWLLASTEAGVVQCVDAQTLGRAWFVDRGEVRWVQGPIPCASERYPGGFVMASRSHIECFYDDQTVGDGDSE